jgi:dolichyl-phosphate-mannose-protein mannosyltransferase
VYDEIYTAFTAHRLARGDDKAFEPGVRRYRYLADDSTDLALVSRAEWSHPPAAPLLMSLAVRLLGFHAAAVRLVSLVFAGVMLLATASLSPRRWWVASTLLALDGMFFVFARTAMPHMILASSITVGAVLLYSSMLHRRRSLALMIGAGACFGLAAAVRWTAVPIELALALALCVSKRRRAALTPRRALAAMLAAVVVYVLAYLPYFLDGHGASDFVALQGKMLWFNRHISAPSSQVSSWMLWPIDIEGVLFNVRTVGDRHAMVVCTGGRVLAWSMIPVLALAVRRWLRTRSARDGLTVAAIVGSWLPWAVLARAGFSYYLLPALPFCAVFLARELHRAGTRFRWATPLALVIATLNFAALYPALAGVPLSDSMFDAYRSALLSPQARKATLEATLPEAAR